MGRWQFHDPVAGDTMVFAHNPATMTSMAAGHSTKALAAAFGKVRALRATDLPFAWSFSGKLRSKAQYDLFVNWAGRPNRLELTDHFGRVHEILPRHFLPTPVANSGTGNDWLFTYTMETLYYRRVS